MEARVAEGGLGRWVVTAFAVAASCTTFEKSDQELNSLVVEATGGVVQTGGSRGSTTGGANGSTTGGTSGSTSGGAGGRFNIGAGGVVPVCGNGVREPGEPCEGSDFGNQTCETLTFGNLPNGTPICLGCTIRTSSCTGDAGVGGFAGTGGIGGQAGTIGIGGQAGTTGIGGQAGTTGFDASACTRLGQVCSTSTAACCGGLGCFGRCCYPVGSACASAGDCCTFDQCLPLGGLGNRCCHTASVRCENHGECCSGQCVQRGTGDANTYCQ